MTQKILHILKTKTINQNDTLTLKDIRYYLSLDFNIGMNAYDDDDIIYIMRGLEEDEAVTSKDICGTTFYRYNH